MTNTPPHVVIVGAGFGGLYAAKLLARYPLKITIVDKRNYHLFQPLLYQVATAALSPCDIAAPIRRMFRGQHNVEVLLGNVTAVDVHRRRVRIGDHAIAYDYAVIATGATHSYRGQHGWEEHAPGLKTIDDALEIRRRVLLAYEMAEKETDPARRRAWLTFVIVGGGPTGVEMAGALAEIARFTLAKDFRRIDPKEARVILVEGGAHVLGTYPPALALKAKHQLERLAVHVWTGARVTSIDADGVSLERERISAKTIIWAAGVSASPIARSLGAVLDPQGRVFVCEDLSLPGHPDVFVIGDLAAIRERGKPVPSTASAAVQEGRHAARCIALSLTRKRRPHFRYVHKGSMATIGRAAAISDFGWLRLSGLAAWFAWLFVHVLWLIGFKNRFSVVWSWAWSYVTLDRGARLITGQLPELARVAPVRRLFEPQEERTLVLQRRS